MKTLETSREKVDKICRVIRRETIEPAEKEAEVIVAEALKKAEGIIAEAEKRASEMGAAVKEQMIQERTVFESSLEQGARQCVELLKQKIEEKLFHPQLQETLEREMGRPEMVAEVITSLVEAVKQEGLEADLEATVAREVDPEKVSHYLAKGIVEKLATHPIKLGDFLGGARLRLAGKTMTVDFTDQAVRDLLAGYLRKDFRKWLFV